MDASRKMEEMALKIAQLEAERKDLQNDVEMLCKQQSGCSGTDIMARLQARKVAGLEEELAACRNKVASLTMDYADLQHDLTGVQKSKESATASLKAQLDKVKRLENDVRFYQTQVVTALAERDEALLEVETVGDDLQAVLLTRDGLQARVQELEHKCKQLEEDQAQREIELASVTALGDDLKKALQCVWAQLSISGRVASSTGEAASLQARDMAAALLLEAEKGPLFCPPCGGDLGPNEDNNSSKLALLEEELEEMRARLESFQAAKANAGADLEEVINARRAAEQSAASTSAALVQLKEQVRREVAEFKCQQRDARFQISLLLDTGRQNISASAEHLLRQVQLTLEQAAIRSSREAEELVENERDRCVRARESLEEQLRLTSQALAKAERDQMYSSSEGSDDSMGLRLQARTAEDEESRNVLAQAMQEKVSALLFLSQQEERHLLEMRSMAGLQEQIEDFRLKLSRVAEEKVNAFMLVADLRAKIGDLEHHQKELEEELQQHRTTKLGGRMLAASWLGANLTPHFANSSSQDSLASHRTMSLTNSTPSSRSQPSLPPGGNYITTWLTRSASGRETVGGGTSSEQSIVARLRVDNTMLLEGIESMHQCALSVQKLRYELAKAQRDADVAETSAHIESPASVAARVLEAAKSMKIALGGGTAADQSVRSSREREREREGEQARVRLTAREMAAMVSVELADQLSAHAALLMLHLSPLRGQLQ